MFHKLQNNPYHNAYVTHQIENYRNQRFNYAEIFETINIFRIACNLPKGASNYEIYEDMLIGPLNFIAILPIYKLFTSKFMVCIYFIVAQS